ncbi:hypothetical protein QUF58_06310 [Anaerolineales bacterium HSG24]|nr:hypothetical protein [Anaerolineales bacterium HSG24]
MGRTGVSNKKPPYNKKEKMPRWAVHKILLRPHLDEEGRHDPQQLKKQAQAHKSYKW